MDQSIRYTLYEVDKISNLAPGTQIAVKALYKNLHPSLGFFYPLFSKDEFYFHHGVYLGDCKVAHFCGPNKSDAKPRESDILQFLRGAVDGKLYRVEYENPDMVRSVEETLSYARQVLQNPKTWPGFQLLQNNCESFATWLKTGVRRSAQAIQAQVHFTVVTLSTSTDSLARGSIRASGASGASRASSGSGASGASSGSGASRASGANSASGASGASNSSCCVV